MNIDEARQLIRMYMRQASGGYYPTQLQMSALDGVVDQATGQKIYDEEIARIEAANGMKLPRWDSERNRPVDGTPKP